MMSYQKVMQPQFFYENPEYFDEADSFIENVSFSESDGFIGFPMVRSVPSYDIQELYIKKPLNTSSQILAVPQRSRRYINGQRDFYPEYVYDLQPRPPAHLRNAHQAANPIKSSLRLSQNPPTNGQRNNYTGKLPRTFRAENNGIIFKSSPTISVRSRIPDTEDTIDECPRNYYKRTGRACTPIPRRHLSCVSEPITNLQGNNLQDSSYRSQPPREFARCQENDQLPNILPTAYKCESNPEIHSEEELKKPNSEGDATGYAGINKMDNISRIAATLDVDEAEKLSDKRRMEIKEMSKFLIPRVPSSIRSLQESTGKKLSDKMKEGLENTSEKNKEKFSLSFRKSLDSVLNQLENCEMSLNAVKSKFAVNKSNSQTSEKTTSMKTESQDDIFNMKEIYSRLRKTHVENSCNNAEEADVPIIISNEDSASIDEKIHPCDSETASRKALDDTSVSELHRSKSYIVNLIDRALSRELGTYTNESSHSFQDLDPVKAIKKIEMNRRMESFITAGKSTVNQECKPSSSYTQGEDHKYIEQLKELRWGHFKHIQQEVKRLEDLERFLDHYGSSDKKSL